MDGIDATKFRGPIGIPSGFNVKISKILVNSMHSVIRNIKKLHKYLEKSWNFAAKTPILLKVDERKTTGLSH